MRVAALLASGLLLQGCATASFAPPSVNLENAMGSRGSNRSFSSSCMPNEKIDATTKMPIPITRDVAGATALIDNFVYMYRCRAHSAANGRQVFEIPALLTAAGSATALAFGAPGEVAIAGGSAVSMLNAGKNYYAPQEKAAIFDSSLDALLCIKTRAVSIDPYAIGTIAAAEEGGSRGAAVASADGVLVTADERYFITVSAALLSVERVLAQRLSKVGTFDPAGVIAEIKTLSDEAKAAETAARSTASQDASDLIQSATAGTSTARAAVTSANQAKIANTIVQLETLQPKLQECVVRAKI